MNDENVARVLLVEDSPLLAERLRELLAHVAGIKVVDTADTESEAIRILRNKRIDIMILDLQLREGTGFGVLRSVQDALPRTVVLTTYALPAYEKRALQLGAEYFLDKTHDFERLPEIVSVLCSATKH